MLAQFKGGGQKQLSAITLGPITASSAQAHDAEVPLTSSMALTADLPSVFKATHTYFPLSSFSAPMICKDPFCRAKNRPPSTVSWVAPLNLREKMTCFTAECAQPKVFPIKLL